MEARADAASEMSELNRDPLEEEFAALETGNVMMISSTQSQDGRQQTCPTIGLQNANTSPLKYRSYVAVKERNNVKIKHTGGHHRIPRRTGI